VVGNVEEGKVFWVKIWELGAIYHIITETKVTFEFLGLGASAN